MIIRVWLIVERSWPTKPAECHVVPSVRSCCSSTTTSRQPRRPRWYAMLAPPTPPPTITQRASVRTPGLVEQRLEVRAVELGHRALVLLHPPGPEVEVDVRHAVLDRRPQRPPVLRHQAP